MTRIVLLHATPVAMEPVRAASATHWPDAELVNLLDDSLSADRARDGRLTPQMIDRFVGFGRYGAGQGADGILVTCSAFGPAIEQLAQSVSIPVLKPNEAMFRSALAMGKRIGMLASFAPAVPTMEDEFTEFVREVGGDAILQTVVVDGAMAALRAGDAAGHNARIAEAASTLGGCDVIMLAQFSMAQAAAKVGGVVDLPVLTAPGAAVLRMKTLVLGEM